MDEWRDIETAPRDGTPCLLLIKNPIPPSAKMPPGWGGIVFVGRNHTHSTSGDLDAGWEFAAPVGYGGLPDEILAGWQPLPTP